MSSKVVPWHRRLFAGFHCWGLGFIWDYFIWVLWWIEWIGCWVFVWKFRFSPFSNISLMPCTHLSLYVSVTRRISRQNLWNFIQSNAVWDVREHWIEMYFHIVSLQQVKLLQRYKWALRQCLWSRYSGAAVSTVESRCLWSVGTYRTVTNVQCTVSV